ncbi:MAG: hypothetical protein IKU90_07845, partial [Clostridia bacterium]|nr:hypothetical protein [Clostridia bacterium]
MFFQVFGNGHGEPSFFLEELKLYLTIIAQKGRFVKGFWGIWGNKEEKIGGEMEWSSNLGLAVGCSFSSEARYPPLWGGADREAVGEVFAKNIFYTNGFDLIHHPSDGPPSPKGKVGERGSKLT